MKNNTNIKYWIALSLCFLFCIGSISAYLQSGKHTDQSQQNITLFNLGFDTPITIEATCSKEDFDQYITIVSDTFLYYNKLFDQYHEYEGIRNIYTLNHEAYNQFIEVDKELIDIIQRSKEIYDLTNQFDITQGSVLSLWHNAREKSIELNNKGKDGVLPKTEALKKASKHTGFDKIVIQDNAIKFLDRELRLDLGGIGKGYAAQKCKERLNEAGLSNGFINAGGNVVLLGKKADGWKIGIQHPDQSGSLLRFKTNEDRAIVTSGDYQRYFTVENQRYSHIIDPDTLYPSNSCRSVTIITEDSTLADGISTALFNLSYEEGSKLVEKLQKNIDLEVIWIFDKKEKFKSDIPCDDFIIKTTNKIRNDITLVEK